MLWHSYHLLMAAHRVWTNSVFGRILCTAFGVIMLLLAFVAEPRGAESWHGPDLLIHGGIALVGVGATFAVWTSRLVLDNGVLTATNFGISRSMRLAEVVDVEPSAFPFLGMKVRRGDKSGIRTLVSGRSWNEPYTPRAVTVGREIETRRRGAPRRHRCR